MKSNYLIDNKIGLLLWKTSIQWQKSLRTILSKHSLTLNEFIILETLSFDEGNNVNQIYLSKSSGVNISVVSTTLDILQKKSLIKRLPGNDNRKKIIKLTENAKSLLKNILPNIYAIESNFFLKLGNEKNNFVNSIKLILGKKIRIKAEKK